MNKNLKSESDCFLTVLSNDAFCKTALSIAWTFEDHGTIPAFEVEVFSAIDQVKV